MNIGLITLHRIVNYGSALQAYATLCAFDKLGHTATIIDYYNERMHLLGMAKRIKNKKELFKHNIPARLAAQCIMMPSYIHRFHTFKKFIKKYYRMTDTTYLSYEELRQNPPIFDVYCTGSDQVWNTAWNECIDKAFFLDFVPKGRHCFSYASSFGKSELDISERTDTARLLKKYDALSVRESSGVDILRDLGFENAINVPDPTLLLDINDWKPMISDRFKNKKYIMVYNLNRDAKIDSIAKKLAKEKNLPVYTICYSYHEKPGRYGKVYCCPPVEDFLSMIYYADYVVTDSFHCTAFSVNFSKKVLIVYPEKFSTRLKSIVELCGLQQSVAADDYTLSADNQIDYGDVKTKLDAERKKGFDFIKSALLSAQE